MKLSLEQRTKLFNIVRERVLDHLHNVDIISSDHPNSSFIYKDSDYEILYYHNVFGVGASTGDILQISLLNKKLDQSVRFDSGDYMFMKNISDMEDLISEMYENVFKDDDDDTENFEKINKILGL